MEMFDKLLPILTWVMVQGFDKYFMPPKLTIQQNMCSIFNSSNGMKTSVLSSCIKHNIPRDIKHRHRRKTKDSETRELIIPIGTIFNSDDVEMRSVFRWALERYHKYHIDNYELHQYINITDVSNNFKLASSLCIQMRTGVFLFFGTKSISSLEIVEDYTRRFHMPYISPSLSRVSMPWNDNFQISMKPNLTKAIFDLIVHFNWDMVHYLYDSNEGLQRLQDIFGSMPSNRSVRFTYRKLEDVDHAHEDLRTLDRMNTAEDKKIILDLSSYKAFTSILRQIAEVGMNKHEYFYLLTTQDFSRLDFRRFVHGGVNLTGFDIVDPNDKRYKHFMSKWKQANPNVYKGSGGELSSNSALAVDSVRLIIETLNSLLAKNRTFFKTSFRRGQVFNHERFGIPCVNQHPNEPPTQPWMHGKAILEAMKQVDFQGITGRVKFNKSDGFREDYVLQVSSVGLHQTPSKIGTWHSKDGYTSLYSKELKEVVHNITDSNVRIISTIEGNPMLMKKDASEIREGNLTGNAIFKGYVADFAKLLAERIGFEYKLVLVPDNKYGRLNEKTGKWDGIMGQLVERKADMAIAGFTITFDREKEVDFTKPFMDLGIGIMIEKPKVEKPGVFSFMQPFNFKIWIFIVVAHISVSIGLFLISRFSPYEWQNIKGEKEPLLNEEFSLLNSFWFSTGALMLQGSDACPRSFSGRVIGTVWWFFVLITISSYTANLAAFLTIEKMVSPIESADDLVIQTEIKYGFLESGTTREYFDNSPIPTYQSMSNFVLSNPQYMANTTEEGIQRVRDSKGKYAFLLESPRIEYENSMEPCNTFKVGRNLNSKGFGVATPKFSPLRDALNLHVLELTEDGTLIKLKHKWWTDRSQCPAAGGKDSSRKRSLSLSNVAGVFYILISGLVIAVIFGAMSFIVLKVRLIPVTNYAKGLTSSTMGLEPSEKENGSLSDYAINNGHSHTDKDIHTYTYNPPPLIGFEAFQQRQEHSDV